MRRLLVVLCVVCLVMLAWMLSGQPASRGADADALEGLRVGAPYRHGNLAIFPVISEVPRQADRFITLDEGLRAGTVEVYEIGTDGNRLPSPAADAPPETVQSGELAPPGADANQAESVIPPEQQASVLVEQSQAQDTAIPQPPSSTVNQLDGEFTFTAGPDVNRLMVVNRSGRPLYLMPGEVIIGGQQDRTIAEEAILAATGEPTPIDVFCVEHGRWSGRDEQEAAEILAAVAEQRSGNMAGEFNTTLSQVVREANSGKFVASAGVLSKASRLATQAAKDQGQVWDAVAELNAASGVAPASGAFTANYVDAGNRRRLEAYAERLEQRVLDEPNVVGVVVAVNGKIEAVDVFESTPLFQKLWPKLLKSYALDAAVGTDGKRPARRATIVAAQDFLAKALTGDVKDESHGQGGLIVQQRAADGVVSFTAAGQPADAGAAPAAGGFGGSGGGVHTSALAH